MRLSIMKVVAIPEAFLLTLAFSFLLAIPREALGMVLRGGSSQQQKVEVSVSADARAAALDFSAHGADWNQGMCGGRKRQSPINFDALYAAPNDRSFGYFYNDVHSQPLKMQNDGVSIFVDTIGQGFGGITLPVRGKPWYNLKRIEFHGVSEHTFRGKHAPLEMHLIHQTSVASDPTFGPDLVVLAIPFSAPGAAIPEPTHPASNELPLAEPTKTNTKKASSSAAAFLQGRGKGRRRQVPEGEGKPATFIDGVEPVYHDDRTEDAVAEEDEYESHLAGTDVNVDERKREGNAEIDWIKTLADAGNSNATVVEGSPEQPRVLIAGLGDAAGAGDASSSDAGAGGRRVLGARYAPPGDGDPDFNPTLQHFLLEEPPVIDKASENKLSPDKPLNLGEVVSQGTFFSYAGSEVAPPCAERVWWYVRRDFPKASTAQVQALVDSLYKMSDGKGNYRTVMPLMERPITIVKAEIMEPATRPVTISPPVGPPWGFDDGRESRYEDYAKDAVTIAKAASDYARDLDSRLSHAAVVHAKVLTADGPSAAATTPQPYPVPPLDQIWAANAIAKRVAAGVEKAIAEGARGIKPLANDLARSYLRQDLLARQGYTTPAPPPVEGELVMPTR